MSGAGEGRQTEQEASATRSWVVEASAGTGKTTALVNRIVEVIAAGTPVETIVAVTFTHAAAGNMKLRVRHELERRRAGETDEVVRLRLAGAARALDRAFIGTIHAFCAQLLRRRPVEARVDPVFQELAQADALRVFARVFRRWIEHKLAAPSPALSRALARMEWREEPLDELRKAAWNLTEWRDFDAPWQQRPFDRDARMQALLNKAEATLRIAARKPAMRPLWEFVERVRRAREAGRVDGDRVESDLLRLPAELRWVKSNDAAGAAWEELKAAIEEFRREADADLASHLRDELWEVAGLYQEEKRRAGQLDFMDLLLCARELLRHDGARADLQRVYQRIFVDEFQDTDPLQAEILLLLACGDAAERDWRKATPAAGKLYVVGDPKQSIYRFRRADARLFHRVCSDAARGGGGGAGADGEHAIDEGDPELCECGVRAHDREIFAAGRRSGCAGGAAINYRAAGAGAVWVAEYFQCEDRRVFAGCGGGIHPMVVHEKRLEGARPLARRMGAGAAGARLHSVPAVHELRHRPDAGVRAVPGGSRNRSPAGGVEILPSQGGGRHAAHGAARDRMAGR